MYLTKDFNYWDLVTSFFKKDEECFELFKSKAKEKGFEICMAQITMLKDSCCAVKRGDFYERVPYLRIYVNGEENFEKVRKENINQGLVNKESEIILRDLFACSLPGVNIVFEQDIYERYQVAAKAKELEEKIKDLAIKTVNAITDGVEVNCKLHVKCWHPKMQGYSGYGLARED